MSLIDAFCMCICGTQVRMVREEARIEELIYIQMIITKVCVCTRVRIRFMYCFRRLGSDQQLLHEINHQVLTKKIYAFRARRIVKTAENPTKKTNP